MKVRNGYVSNSSSASFIVTENISKDRFTNLIKQSLYEVLCESAKKKWEVATLSNRQKAAVRRDTTVSSFWNEYFIEQFNPSNFEIECWSNQEVDAIKLKGKWQIIGDNYKLHDVVERLKYKVKGIYQFWG